MRIVVHWSACQKNLFMIKAVHDVRTNSANLWFMQKMISLHFGETSSTGFRYFNSTLFYSANRHEWQRERTFNFGFLTAVNKILALWQKELKDWVRKCLLFCSHLLRTQKYYCLEKRRSFISKKNRLSLTANCKVLVLQSQTSSKSHFDRQNKLLEKSLII